MQNKPRILTPGPTPLPEEVRLALARDMIHHRKPEFKKIIERIRPALSELFGTTQDVLPLTCSGTGAMVAAVTSLFAPGERVLVAQGGKFGERWAEIAASHGLSVTNLKAEWGAAVDPEAVRQALDADPSIRGVLIQASETSTGVLHPIAAISAITRLRDVMCVVDGISAIGISPCPMDAWGIDCLLTGSQKGLMLPPGLAFIALSERAWTRVRAAGPGNFYFNLLGERDNCRKNQTLFTPAINLFVGLDVCLDLFRAQGLDNVYRKQWALTRMARAGVEAIGLELFAPTAYTWGLTSVRLPAGIEAATLLSVAAKKYGVIMAGGQGHLKNAMIRLGHMGHVDFADILAGLYALCRAYVDLGGYTASRSYLEVAMSAYEQAMEAGYPLT